MPMLWPRTCTRIWSLMVLGLVRKKKPRVMWKRQREVRIVLAEMSAMVVVLLSCLLGRVSCVGAAVGGVVWLG